METIEQRISREMDEFTQQHPTDDKITLKLRSRVVPLMVALCKEQQNLDIQRACEWLEDCMPNIEYSVFGSKFQGKSVFIETFKQAMKG